MRREENRPVVVGVGWYSPGQWALLKAKSVDSKELEASHDEWLANAEKTLARMRKAGAQFKKIDIDVEEMIRWCQSTGNAMDGKARAEFIARKTQAWNQK